MPRPRLAAALLTLAAAAGCASMPFGTPVQTSPASNPFFLPGNPSTRGFERAWETSVDVLHKYGFRIANENRAAFTIETEPMTGSGIFEPWFRDTVGRRNRWESTLQSIRRRVTVTVAPAESGEGFVIGVEAIKEREDVAGLAAQSPGGNSFQEYRAGEVRDLNPVVGQTRPSGWIVLGRDFTLEQDLLQSLQLALTE